MNNGRKIRIQIILTEEELKIFQSKSHNYDGNVSALIRDGVNRFEDQKVRGRIEAMTSLLDFYKTYQQQLSWLSGNFNQTMKRANELAIAGELSESFFHNVIMPQAQTILQFLRSIKSSLDTIHDNLEK